LKRKKKRITEDHVRKLTQDQIRGRRTKLSRERRPGGGEAFARKKQKREQTAGYRKEAGRLGQKGKTRTRSRVESQPLGWDKTIWEIKNPEESYQGGVEIKQNKKEK